MNELQKWNGNQELQLPQETKEFLATIFEEGTAPNTLKAHRRDVEKFWQWSDPIVFGEPIDGILFQVYKSGFKGTIPGLPHIKHNDNVVYFDKYFALQMSNLLVFIEDVSCYISKKYNLYHHNAISTGFDTLYHWIAKFNEELKYYLNEYSRDSC